MTVEHNSRRGSPKVGLAEERQHGIELGLPADVDRHALTALQQRFRIADRRLRIRGELTGKISGRLEQFVIGHRAQRKPYLDGFSRMGAPAREDQLARTRVADDTWQALRSPRTG